MFLVLAERLHQLRPHTKRLQYLVVPPFPLVSWARSAKCFWHISPSLSCPKQPLYQNYPPEENQFVYLWRVLHIRHFKPLLACSFTEKTSAGLKCVEEVDRFQQAKEQFMKRWPEQTSADRQTSASAIIHTTEIQLTTGHLHSSECFCIFRKYYIL